MARRNAATIRPLEADTEFRSRLVQQVINKVMRDGKKSLAEKITYDALAIVGERSGEDPVAVLKEAIDELTPQLEVRSRRVGGATYQVPVEVPDRRGRTLAVRWLVDFSRNRGEYSMSERLANEILDARRQQGNAWKRKDDIFRMAQANKAFAHYRW
jgi:small subunit ribosomal protein S7